MDGQLALVQTLVVFTDRLEPQRPMAHVARVLDQETVVAAVRGQADGQQLKVTPSDP